MKNNEKEIETQIKEKQRGLIWISCPDAPVGPEGAGVAAAGVNLTCRIPNGDIVERETLRAGGSTWVLAPKTANGPTVTDGQFHWKSCNLKNHIKDNFSE